MRSEFNSVCLILVKPSDDNTDSDSSTDYGTGFFIHANHSHTYIATCAHVVREAHDENKTYEILIEGFRASISAYDSDCDIAILQVEQLWPAATILPLSAAASEHKKIKVIGMSALTSNREKQGLLVLNGFLLKESAWVISSKPKISTWYVQLEESSFGLQSGYSGAPVISTQERCVVAIMSHKVKSPNGSIGISVSASNIKTMWEKYFNEKLLLPAGKFGGQLLSEGGKSAHVKYYDQKISNKYKLLQKLEGVIAVYEDENATESDTEKRINANEKIRKKQEDCKKILLDIEELKRQAEARIEVNLTSDLCC